MNLYDRAESFVKVLYQSCDKYADLKNRDPWHDKAREMLIALYVWLFENCSIDESTSFVDICKQIHSIAIYFFTLDLDECSETTQQYIALIRADQLKLLEHNNTKNLVIGDFRVIFDLTCAGIFVGDNITY